MVDKYDVHWRKIYAIIGELNNNEIIAVIGVTDQAIDKKIEWLAGAKPLTQKNAIGLFMKNVRENMINSWLFELESIKGDLDYADKIKSIWREVGESKEVFFPTFANKYRISVELANDELRMREWPDLEIIKKLGSKL